MKWPMCGEARCRKRLENSLPISNARVSWIVAGKAARNFVHPKVMRPITISGKLGDDARHYQIRAVKIALQEARK